MLALVVDVGDGEPGLGEVDGDGIALASPESSAAVLECDLPMIDLRRLNNQSLNQQHLDQT